MDLLEKISREQASCEAQAALLLQLVNRTLVRAGLQSLAEELAPFDGF